MQFSLHVLLWYFHRIKTNEHQHFFGTNLKESAQIMFWIFTLSSSNISSHEYIS